MGLMGSLLAYMLCLARKVWERDRWSWKTCLLAYPVIGLYEEIEHSLAPSSFQVVLAEFP